MNDNEQIEHLKRELERAIESRSAVEADIEAIVEQRRQDIDKRANALFDELVDLRARSKADRALAAVQEEISRQRADFKASRIDCPSRLEDFILGEVYYEVGGARLIMRLESGLRSLSVTDIRDWKSLTLWDVEEGSWVPLVNVWNDLRNTSIVRAIGVALGLKAEDL